ncbi:MAG: nucleotide sugar dehydrogenase, partial [Patescibacteria group bacterium]
MRVAVVGTGYVGLVSGACLAELGHDVVCVDVHAHKIALLCAGVIPIYEQGLKEIVQRNIANRRLKFTTSYPEAIPGCDVAMIAVGTPSAADGSVDMQYVESAARMIGEHLTGYTVLIDKSTVPVGTTERVTSIVERVTSCPFDVVSVPEFLREGQAVKDFLYEPSRIVIGSSSDRATRIVLRLFASLKCPKVVMDPKSAELTKYAGNVFLALKVVFANMLYDLADSLDIPYEEVRDALAADPRIG